MKKVLTVTLTSLMLFLFSGGKAQNTEILRSFINKNDFVLRSVQKNSIRLADNSSEVVIRSILKLQLISIKYYESNKNLSKQAAYQARLEGLQYLDKSGVAPVKHFQITEKEKVFFGKQELVSSPDDHLSAEELKLVGEMDPKDPASLNSFIITLQ